jgi:hypothetical protein
VPGAGGRGKWRATIYLQKSSQDQQAEHPQDITTNVKTAISTKSRFCLVQNVKCKNSSNIKNENGEEMEKWPVHKYYLTPVKVSSLLLFMGKV